MNNKKVNSIQDALNEFKHLTKNNFDHNCEIKNIFLDEYPDGNYEKNIIFYGPPGTGKTHGIRSFLVSEKIDENHIKWIQCHQNFKYDDFIEGIKPTGMLDSQLKLDVVSGAFKDLCIRAKTDIENSYFFVADEINRTNVSSMFGEVLAFIEDDYRDNPSVKDKKDRNLVSTPLSNVIKARMVDLIISSINNENIKELENFIKNNVYEIEYEGQYLLNDNEIKVDLNDNKVKINEIEFDDNSNFEVKFGVPKNVVFIGMMNDVDKSLYHH